MNSKKTKKKLTYGVIALTLLGTQTLVQEKIHADDSTTTVENGSEQAKKGTIEVSIIDSSSGKVLKSFDITDDSGIQLQTHDSEIKAQISSLYGYVFDISQGSYDPTFIGGKTGEAKFYVKKASSGTINVNIIDSSSGQVLKNFDITDFSNVQLQAHESEIESQIASLKGYVLDQSQGSYAPNFIGGETAEAKFYVKKATSGTINVNIIDSSSGQVLKNFNITDIPGQVLDSHESEIENQIASLKGYVLDKSQGSYDPTFIGGETGEAKFYVKKATSGTINVNIIDSSSGQVLKNFNITDIPGQVLDSHESEIENQIASLKGYVLDKSQGSYDPTFIGGETGEAKFYVKKAESGTINVNIIDSSSGQVLKNFNITDIPGQVLDSHESEIENQIASLKGYVLDKSQGSYDPTFIGGETGEAKFYVKKAESGTINVNIIDSSSGQVLKNFNITDIPGQVLDSHESEIENQIASLKGYVLDKSQGSYDPTFIGGETGEAKFYVKKSESGTSKINITTSSNAQVIKNNDAKALKQSSGLTESQAQKKSSIDEDSKNQKIIANEKKSNSLPHTGESSSFLSYSLGTLTLLGASFFFMIKRFKNL